MSWFNLSWFRDQYSSWFHHFWTYEQYCACFNLLWIYDQLAEGPGVARGKKNECPIGHAVWPALGNIYIYECLVLLYRYTIQCPGLICPGFMISRDTGHPLCCILYQKNFLNLGRLVKAKSFHLQDQYFSLCYCHFISKPFRKIIYKITLCSKRTFFFTLAHFSLKIHFLGAVSLNV